VPDTCQAPARQAPDPVTWAVRTRRKHLPGRVENFVLDENRSSSAPAARVGPSAMDRQFGAGDPR
jgi:hypothetical protein